MLSVYSDKIKVKYVYHITNTIKCWFFFVVVVVVFSFKSLIDATTTWFQKFIVGLKSLLKQVLTEYEYYGDFVHKFTCRTNVERNELSDLFRK